MLISSKQSTLHGSLPNTLHGSLHTLPPTNVSAHNVGLNLPTTAVQASPIDPGLKHILPNGITIYGTKNTASEIVKVVNEFPEIWIDRGTTVDIPEEQWMPIHLKPGAEPKPVRMYPVSHKDQEIIDETFDKLHSQGKMTWFNKPTPFSYPVFVV